MTDTRMTDPDLQAMVDRCLRLKTLTARQQRLDEWRAFCPVCQADILDELEKAAHASDGYGPREHCIVCCPGCGDEVEFDLEWETILAYASLALPRGPA